MERRPVVGETYRHFKNKNYKIIAIAHHSETGEELVIYQALYGDGMVCARPLDMFVSEVDHEKYPEVTQKYRFERVELGESELTDAGVSVSNVAVESMIPVQNCQDETVPVREAEEEYDEGMSPEPGLLEFLDESDWDMKYNILVSLRDKMTDKLVDDLAVVLDVVIPDGPLDKRYEQLKICLRTRQKYESQHLR